MVQYGTVEQIVDSLRDGRGTGGACTLLLGAGCSKSAGIPLAAEMAALARKRFPAAFSSPEIPKGYAATLAALEEGDRQALFADVLGQARLNVAHLAIAQLFVSGYVDSILTTNFDPLLAGALALAGAAPPIYDMTGSPRFRFRLLGTRAVVHLHGQRGNALLLSGREDYEWHAAQIAPLFEDAGRDRMWIVAGYGGDNDPTIDLLGKVHAFDRGLFWCGTGPTVPDVLREKLFIPRKTAYFVPDCDADRLFAGIARALGCPPPDVLARPLARAREALSRLAPFPHAKDAAPIDSGASVRGAISEAAAQYETTLAPEVQFLQGDFEAVIDRRKEILVDDIPSAVDVLAWSYLERGRDLAEKGRLDADGMGRRSFVAAYDSFAAALGLQPSMHQALTSWGAALLDQAEMTPGSSGDAMHAEAYRKFTAALAIDANLADVYYKWGNGLISQAERKGVDAESLLAAAYDKFARAVAIRPDMFVAYNNWGIALSDQAKMSVGTRAGHLFDAAYGKFAQAVAIKPDLHETYYNWAIALFDHACAAQDEDESNRLYAEAFAKYAEAAQLRPSGAEIFFNWGWALSMQASGKSGEEADRLFSEAHAHYEEALRLRPDMSDLHHNWAWSLAAQARLHSGADAIRRFEEASAKYAEAVARNPRDFNVINNWGSMLCDQALASASAGAGAGAESDRLFALAYEKFALALRYKPDMDGAYTNWGGALSAQGQRKTGEERRRLLEQAVEKCRRVEELRPGRGAYNLACLASLLQNEDECRKWLDVARDSGSLPDGRHLAGDMDLAFVRDRAWFRKLLGTFS
ncbi:MAG: hypothetical protein HQL33_10165 [Alphaproteobacteria bacterium]|nr:hypothetical protein [Alphaproteobacteria bacterium]